MVLLSAPAKLTLSLRVLGVRGDGMHEIDAEMVSIDLCDVVEIQEGGRGVEVLVEPINGSDDASALGGPMQPPAGMSVPHGEQNLALQALRYAGAEARLVLRKRVPAGAGLGGGSSDAAAVMRWAGISDPGEAALIGSDVAFCLVGGRARVSGAGEVVEPLEFEQRTLTLMLPPFGCSTAAVYRQWDEMNLRGGTDRHTSAGPGNDLEDAALAVEPRLAEWRERLAAATGRQPRLAGSGSTWFVEGSYPGPDRVVVRTVPAGWRAPGADR